MKKLVLWFLILMGIATINLAFAKTAIGDIFETQSFVEKEIKLEELSIKDDIPFWIITNILEQECSPTIINESKMIVEHLGTLRWKNIPKWKIETEMRKRFNLLKKVILSIAKKDKTTFCKQKYITYGILEITQEIFNREKYGSTTGKIEDWKKIKNPETQTKTEMNTQSSITWELEHSSAEQKKDYVQLQHNTTNLTGKEKMLAQITERSVQTVLETMVAQRLLGQEDIKILDGAIHIQYAKTCEKTIGSFHAVRSKSTQQMRFKEIKLNINICSSEGFYNNFDKYIKQILTHELWHYVYFFKDKQTEKFDKICRNGKEKLCQNNGFFSTYAQNNKEEDYAESFAYWYLDTFNGKEKKFWSAPASEIQNQKERYFDELIQSLK